MDFILRCNSLKCRTQLIERAVVTTCSHIFCIACSETLGLVAVNGPNRHCPACRTQLANPDDVVATSLNPTEDYKTSVLSGLSPNIIMECASRGLAFWSYQSTQEVVYQEYLAKTLTDKYGTLNVQMDKLVNDANAEIEALNQRLSQLQLEQEKLKQDNQTLLHALREKNKKHAQTRDLYERLKRKEMTAATQHAAYDSVDEALHAATSGNQPATQLRGARASNGISVNTFGRGENMNHRSNHHHGPIHIRADSGELPKSNFLAERLSSNFNGTTPSSIHRTRLGGVAGGNYPHQNSHETRPAPPLFPRPSNQQQHSSGIGLGQTAPIRRPPLEGISGNASITRRDVSHSNTSFGANVTGHGNASYGLSAGMRSGSLHGAEMAGTGSASGGGGGGLGFDHGNGSRGVWMN